MIITDIQSALSNFLKSCLFIDLLESVIEALKLPNPNVVKFTTKFINEGVSQTYIDDLNECKNMLIPSLVSHANHSDSEVRDAILESLGLLKGRLGEAVMGTYLKEFNQ